ncbi:hypothetical protein FUA23_16000 [Neolewinella aurantiaca]|uniref:PsbP C-terminal domain-containing protein n=1 Tax=Neolewinella aurantiaca TaxID=2602767 RepID=A0A5C7FBB2_9BACT|nr:hypothetical protein [Neolewinella aurantiaca]TXF88142.1 hypothetical protein FUA23_16000 [Neolewinella aurantiaca]
MQRLLITLLLLSFLTALSAQTPMLINNLEKSWEQQARWEERNDVDGRFKLLAPAALTHNIDTVETGIGQQAYHTFFLQAPDKDEAENIIYAISYVDYPEGTLHHDSLELVNEFLTGTEEEAAKAVGGEVIYSSDKQISGFPARQWRIDYPSKGGTASARTLAGVANNRYYELKVFSLQASGLNKSADRFFDSVRLFSN